MSTANTTEPQQLWHDAADDPVPQLRGWRWRRRRHRSWTARSHTWTHARAAGSHAGPRHHSRTAGSRHHSRTARGAGRDAGCARSGDDDPSPGTGRRAARGEHAVRMVAMAVAMPRDCGTREEDDRHHENDSGDDYYPRGDLVKPAGSRRARRRCRTVWRTGRRWRGRSGRRRRRRRFRCFGHALNHAQPTDRRTPFSATKLRMPG
jgi:hypothetical protein